jgi:iron complex transport system ATP-binding protein
LRDQGKSIAMVLHEVNYAAAWADHVVALKKGRVAACGAPDEVFAEDGLSGIYDTRLRVKRQDGRPLVLHHL